MEDQDRIILKVNDLKARVEFCTAVMAFENIGTDGPFSLIRTGAGFPMRLAPCGAEGFEHYAFDVSRTEFSSIYGRIKELGLEYDSTFDSVGSLTGRGTEFGVRGDGPTVYFNDPNKHLTEIRTNEDDV